MEKLKDIVFKHMRHLHQVKDGQLDRDIAKLEKELEETAASLAKLRKEQENNREAVKDSCEMFGFVIGGFKDDPPNSKLFYDQKAADEARRKTKDEYLLESSMSSPGYGSLAKMMVEEGRLPSE